MAYADPTTITIAGNASTLARVYERPGVGTFSGPDDALQLEIRPTVTPKGRLHKVVQLFISKNATDPGTNLTSRVGATVSVVVDTPPAGFTDAEIVDALSGFLTWLTASTNANLKKFVAGEN